MEGIASNTPPPGTPGPSTARNAPPTPHSARRTPSRQTTPQAAPSPRLNRQQSRSSLPGQHTPDQTDKRPTPKRSISNLISGLREAQATMKPILEPVILTAPDVARMHFVRELARMQDDVAAETLVVLHDACYGHRFSRPKTSKGNLAMIVERPERLHAGVLGAATAFVRMGGHEQGGRHAPHPERKVDGPPPFKIRRTAREMEVTAPCVTSVHGTAWMGELKGMCGLAGERLAKGEKELTRSASTDGTEKRTLHQGDLYLCQESLQAFQGALGGVADAVDAVFDSRTQTSRAFVAVRPPGHHCSADFPSGFCWLNNVHVGLEYAAQTHGLTHAAIIDFDLHHGDGSQAITWERNGKNYVKRQNGKLNKSKLGPDIGYYSLHDINSYPCELGDDEKVQAASLCIENAHCQSIWNVHLQTWKTIDEFWQLYEDRYRVLIDKARVFLRHHTERVRSEGKIQPKAAIFISAGFDASEYEGEGMQRHKVNVPTEFYARFTSDIVQLSQETGSGCDGRVISVLEGGYSDRALCSGVLSHLSGLCLAEMSITNSAYPPQQSGLGRSMHGANGALSLEQQLDNMSLSHGSGPARYDPSWWSAANLTALDNKVHPPPPPGAGKKVRVGQQPTYATPTESFAYKVVDAQRYARTISGTMREVPAEARPPTPPPPEVDWITAAQELSKLLIPQDRQTLSCTAEELAGPKAEKRHVSPPVVIEGDVARQLRTRATKPARAGSSEHLRVVSRTDRRRTIAELPSSTESVPQVTQQRRTSRRSSMASTMSVLSDESAAPPMPAMPGPGATANGAMRPPAVPKVAVKPSVVVKKTRSPAKPATVRRITDSASAPVSPAVGLRPVENVTLTATQSPTSGGVPASPTPTQLNSVSEFDALVSKTSKLRLNPPISKEEHERKLKEKLAAERRASALKGAETRRLNAAARKAAMGAPAEAKSATILTPAQKARLGPQAGNYKPPAPLTAVQAPTPDLPNTVASMPALNEALETGPAYQASQARPLFPAELPSRPLEISASVTPAASPYHPQAELQPSTHSLQLPLPQPEAAQPPVDSTQKLTPSSPLPVPSLLPNMQQEIYDSPARQLLHEEATAHAQPSNGHIDAKSSPVREQKPENTSYGALPVWSATGAIPFATPPAGAEGDDVWEVPVTPAKPGV
ncbi:histone deacetylase [Oleoguttula sp. CCFEE 5521]